MNKRKLFVLTGFQKAFKHESQKMKPKYIKNTLKAVKEKHIDHWTLQHSSSPLWLRKNSVNIRCMINLKVFRYISNRSRTHIRKILNVVSISLLIYWICSILYHRNKLTILCIPKFMKKNLQISFTKEKEEIIKISIFKTYSFSIS